MLWQLPPNFERNDNDWETFAPPNALTLRRSVAAELGVPLQELPAVRAPAAT